MTATDERRFSFLERLDKVKHLPCRLEYIALLEEWIADGRWPGEWEASIVELEQRDRDGVQ